MRKLQARKRQTKTGQTKKRQTKGGTRQSDLRYERLHSLLPPLLKEHGIDLWLVFAREGARDPLAGDVGLGAVVARAAALVGWRGGRFTAEAVCASYDVTPIAETGLFSRVTPYRADGIGPALREAVESWQPGSIALNVSRDLPVADGLTHGMRLYLEEILGPVWAARFR
jgi:hypothetical protein